MSSEKIPSPPKKPFFKDPKKVVALLLVVILVMASIVAIIYYLPKDWDGDGMPNSWEMKYGLNPRDASDASIDSDNDGYDFNRDGIIDEDEQFTNLEEYLSDTDPTRNDTDGDQMYDGWEVWYLFDPLDSDDGVGDADEDLLMNVGEFLFGTPPRIGDIDEDFLLDSGEVGFETDPYNSDTDGDGLLDSVELFDYFAYDSIKVKEKLGMWMPPVERVLQISEEGHYRLKIPALGVMYFPRVLVVNDDKVGRGDFSADVFASRLINFGLRIEMVDSTQMRAINLLEYDFVVWSSSDDPNPLANPSYRQALIDFVLNGGRLLIEGGDFSKLLDSAFYTQVLHIQYFSELPVGTKNLVPFADHPVSSGFTLYENVSVVNYVGSDADPFMYLNDSLAVFRWEDFPVYGLNTYDDNADVTDGGQIVYMAFDVTEIEDSSQMLRLVDNSIRWLNPFPTDVTYNMTKLMEAIEIVVEKDGVEIQPMYNNTIISNATSYLSAGYNKTSSFWLRSYDLDSRTYSVIIDLNESAIIGEVPDAYNFTIFLSYILVEKFQLDPLNMDVDGDGLLDGWEVAYGTYPLNVDSDHDELTDYSELVTHITNPLNWDSDGDMLADGLELGIISDADPTTKTDPMDADTDDDGLYDGWLDENGDEIFSSGETGEDVNQNGKRDATETDPTKWSTDGDSLPDGWEVSMHLDPLSGTGVDGDNGNPDGDINRYNQSFTNIMEFNLGTNPKPYDWDGNGTITGGFEDGTDYDEDGLQDGQEVFVVFRTSVVDGVKDIENYAVATVSDWIYYDQNITDGLSGKAYVFDSVQTNASSTSTIYAKNFGVEGIFRLVDGTRIFFDGNLDRIYVWEPFSDFGDRDGNGVLEGTCYIFVSSTMSVVSSDLPVAGYPNRELYWSISPFIPDSDYDGLLDGEEALYDQDTDQDGYLNALDLDSDNDGIADFIEQTIYSDTDVDGDGLENMVDRDSDNDGVTDDKEQQPFSHFDADGLINLLDSDSDDDGLLDGEEDSDGDGFTDAEEPSPLIVDTDGDGLTDYEEVNIGTDGYITDPTDEDTDDDDLLDGVEVAGWDITVNGATVHVYSNPTLQDSDGDGLTDHIEFLFTNPMAGDTDFDYLLDSQEDKNLNGVWDPGETNPTDRDTDDDLLLDGIEGWGLVTDPLDPDSDDDLLLDGIEDADKDGFTDPGETSPLDPDTDNDGLKDGEEVTYGTNPLDNDSDNDGILDGTEPAWNVDFDNDGLINARDTDSDNDTVPDGTEDANHNGIWEPNPPFNETNPLNGDSDLDGLLDGTEDANGNGSWDPGVETNPLDDDTDNDGLLDGEEDANLNGSVDSGETDPLDDDTDDDLLKDGEEVNTYGTNPLNPHSDSDSLNDYEEVNIGTDGYITDSLDEDSDDDGLWDDQEKSSGTDPNDPDTDDDGIPDKFEALYKAFTGLDPLNGTDFLLDFDNDTLTNLEEYELGELYGSHNIDGDSLWNIKDNDDDEDEMPTAWELRYNLKYYNATDKREDYDGDGWLNYVEYLYGTDPTMPDTDGDYLSDRDEFYASTDPLNNDTDSDGLLDGVEYNGWITLIIYGTNDTQEVHVSSDPTRINSDSDTLTDYEEFIIGTDPRDADTDDDGLRDDVDPSPLVKEFNSPTITDFTITVDVHISLEAIYETVEKTVKKTKKVWESLLKWEWKTVWETVYETVITGYREVLDWVKVKGTFWVEDGETTLKSVKIDINGNVKIHYPYVMSGWFSHEVDIGSAIYRGFHAKVEAKDNNENMAEYQIDIPAVADAVDTVIRYAEELIDTIIDLGKQAWELLKEGALYLVREILKPALEALLGYIQRFAGLQSRFLAPYLNTTGALERWLDAVNAAVNVLDIPDPVDIIEYGFKVAGEFIEDGMVTLLEGVSTLYDILQPRIEYLPLPDAIKDMSDSTIDYLLDLGGQMAQMAGSMDAATLKSIFDQFIDKMEVLSGVPIGDILPNDLSEFLTWPAILKPDNPIYDLLIGGVDVPTNQSVSGIFIKIELAFSIPTEEGPGIEISGGPAISFYFTNKGLDVYFVLQSPSAGPCIEAPINIGYAYGDRDRRGWGLGYNPLGFGITDIQNTPVDLTFTDVKTPAISYSWALFSYNWS